MKLNEFTLNRQIGRNAHLFAEAITRMETAEERHPYVRMLIDVLEQRRPDWSLVEDQRALYMHVIGQMSGNAIAEEEIDLALNVRKIERSLLQDGLSPELGVAPFEDAPSHG
jgi:hypothetical protein